LVVGIRREGLGLLCRHGEQSRYRVREERRRARAGPVPSRRCCQREWKPGE
jgi:hypothetical protein